jgi:hypothetical protein
MTETQFLQQTSVEAWILNRSDVAVKANFNMTVQTHFNEYAPLAYEWDLHRHTHTYTHGGSLTDMTALEYVFVYF